MKGNLKNLFVTIFIAYANITSVSANAKITACETGILPVAKVISAGKECSDDPCIVVPGTDISMQMNFTSPKYLDNIVPQVTAHYQSVNIPFPLDQKNACDGITNTPCPIAKNEKVNYGFSLRLFSLLPPIQLSLTFSINDKNKSPDEAVVCFNLNLQVQPK